MQLEKEEAEMLATASVPVLDLFDYAPDPRFIAVFGLLTAGAQVYGPRAYLIRARLKEEAEAKRAERARNITPLHAAQ